MAAQVAVSDATMYYDKLYTYRVPALMEGHIFVGSMVLVPFGAGRAAPRVGVVVELGTAVEEGAAGRPEAGNGVPGGVADDVAEGFGTVLGADGPGARGRDGGSENEGGRGQDGAAREEKAATGRGADAPGAKEPRFAVNGRTKELLAVAPEEAALTEELLMIVRYLKEGTFCTWYEAVKAVLPYGAQYRAKRAGGGWQLEAQMRRHTEKVYAIHAAGAAALAGKVWPADGVAGEEPEEKGGERTEEAAGAVQTEVTDEDLQAPARGANAAEGQGAQGKVADGVPPDGANAEEVDAAAGSAAESGDKEKTDSRPEGGCLGADLLAEAGPGGAGPRSGPAGGEAPRATANAVAAAGAAVLTQRVAAGRAVPEAGAKPAKLTPKQRQVLAVLAEGVPYTAAEITGRTGAGRAVVEGLVKKGLVHTGERDRTVLPGELTAGEAGLALGDDPTAGAGLMLDTDLPVEAGPSGAEPQAAESVRVAAEGTQPCPSDAEPKGPDGVFGADPVPLSPAQQQVADTLRRQMRADKPKPALLYGVTGSGKTMVFLSLVASVLAAGKTALVLVPEIGLTPQMIRQLQAAFGSAVAVQHSALSATERLLQWRQIRRGEAQVVVGTRSAVFAPLADIGLIIVDEEQERTYQSENAPRYNALEVARRRAAYHGALLLLSSATPAIADYHAAVAGRYELLCLRQRYGDVPLPQVEMVDMRSEVGAGNTGAVSGRLAGAMRQVIADGGQVILLLNRRGYHRVGVCRECGHALKCGECSVPMVYHRGAAQNTAAGAQTTPGEKAAGRLLCHYCGRSVAPAPTVCPECGGEVRYSGVGTQRLEEELAALLPGARVLRMDLDSTARKGAHGQMLSAFAKGEYDILLGTQMVAKGLDFERVRLVGVIGIDSLLFGQGYRAYENVFSLVTQVVGRAGRAAGAENGDGQPLGRAMIQTMDPENPVLTLAAKQDYDAFYRQEIAFRKLALYPPFCTLCVVGFVAEDAANALLAARRFGVLLAGQAAETPGVPLRVLGPAPMSVAQVAGAYRYRLTLKCRPDAAFRALVTKTLVLYNKEGWPRKATLFIDFYSDGA